MIMDVGRAVHAFALTVGRSIVRHAKYRSAQQAQDRSLAELWPALSRVGDAAAPTDGDHSPIQPDAEGCDSRRTAHYILEARMALPRSAACSAAWPWRLLRLAPCQYFGRARGADRRAADSIRFIGSGSTNSRLAESSRTLRSPWAALRRFTHFRREHRVLACEVVAFAPKLSLRNKRAGSVLRLIHGRHRHRWLIIHCRRAAIHQQCKLRQGRAANTGINPFWRLSWYWMIRERVYVPQRHLAGHTTSRSRTPRNDAGAVPGSDIAEPLAAACGLAKSLR